MLRRFRTYLIPAAALATVAATAGPALADNSPPIPRNATVACQITTPGCVEPVVAIAQTSADNFNPTKDAALSVVPGPRVFTRPNNALDNGTQDWQAIKVGDIPNPGGGSLGLGLTAFDRANYAGDDLFILEWTPFGQDSGRCLSTPANTGSTGTLRNCNPLARAQVFFVDRTIPQINPPAAANYTFALSARQSANIQRHRLLTANDTGFGVVFLARAINHSPGVATAQMWSALP